MNMVFVICSGGVSEIDRGELLVIVIKCRTLDPFWNLRYSLQIPIERFKKPLFIIISIFFHVLNCQDNDEQCQPWF